MNVSGGGGGEELLFVVGGEDEVGELIRRQVFSL